ncbi:MAG: polyprenyl diphosphate synthase [Microgenomates group bacterium]|jgi:undecaprenyl diphosphate synthase|nr:di-trans,poly-cis-decaprenylcistransferase [Candidatus Woesebacteria bacterium]MBP6882983.1 di-trans,poly-cis-decaprenylcistransferase [Candidatus Woesebacteria bacterium]QQR63745.1 MAG: di-trans,poly-cis-decaprenylcistransferase [Candidatus Roizmanbacteria bacterium]
MKQLQHIAIIPDGNRRWAKLNGLPTIEGHRRGFEMIQKLAKYLRSINVRILTVWAFSTENWNRDKSEIDYLMGIYERWLDIDLKTALKEEIRIIHLGRKDRLNESLRKKLEEAEEKTKHFTKFYLGVALDYGGRDELLRATQQVLSSKFSRHEVGIRDSEESGKILSESDFEQFLDTKDFPYPDPDLIIRTSGEMRTSGFMSWQSAYSEYMFPPIHLPDFTVDELKKCIDEYNQRQRRFGR